MNSQTWISEFLFTRAMFKGPNGKPLYSYQVTEEEYFQLVSLLKTSCFNIHPSFTKPHPTAACFCLFVAEYYRRFYNSSWSWSGPEQKLGLTITQEDRSVLVKRGLEYWGRELKTQENGHSYLGSLFAEGGLPWPLVKSDQHGFGKAIKRGIKNFYRSEELKRSLTDLMQDHQTELPQSFQNFETIQLLSAIVHQLMSYAQKIPPEHKQDPARYLDKYISDWNKAFPIPLDIANGRLLVNEWLTDAVHIEGEQKLSLEKQKAYTAQHFVTCFLPETRIESEVFLPRDITINIDPSMLSTMRFETALYEGDRLVLKSMAVYGQIADNGVGVRVSVTSLKVARNKTEVPLFFKLLENGRPIFTSEIDNSTLDIGSAPLIAVEDEQSWRVVASASCKLKAGTVRTLLPAGAELSLETEMTLPEPIAAGDFGSWYQLSSSHNISTSHDKFVISLNSDQELRPFKLSGIQYYGDTSPQTVYLGLPTLLSNTNDDIEPGHYSEFFNGIPRHKCFISAGAISFQVKDAAGNTVYRRQFGLLPADFAVKARAATIDGTATITFNSRSPISVQAELSEFYDINAVAGELNAYDISAKQQNKLPAALFKISCRHNEKSLFLRQRYPAAGAKLLSPEDDIATNTELLLQQLAGYRLLLCAPNGVAETFTLSFAVMNRNGPVVNTTKKVKISAQTETLSLYGFYQDFIQLLSVTDDQDAYIQLEVKTNKIWLTLFVRRYNAKLLREGDSYLAVTFSHFTGLRSTEGQDLFAMSLSDPLRGPVCLEKHVSESVPSGLYHTDKLSRLPDLWLVYAPAHSELSFRPFLYVTLNKEATVNDREINTLHSATLAYHPVINPEAINKVIALMAEDYHHSGWQYLAALKQNFAHLPLSTFEAWKALAQCPAALALAIFRLELDEGFCLRLRDELAVMFETIPLATWIAVRKQFKALLKAAGLPDVFVTNTLKNRDGVMRLVVSGFDHITDYLDTGNIDALKLPPLDMVLPIWYQQLRRAHADDDWPETLKAPLRAWLAKTTLPDCIKHLTERNYTDSITYLPIFMAFVSVGKASLADLDGNQVLIKFYIKQHAEFDRRWFLDLHALMVAHITKYNKD